MTGIIPRPWAGAQPGTGAALLAMYNEGNSTPELGLCECGHYGDEHVQDEAGVLCEGCRSDDDGSACQEFRFDDASTAEAEHIWNVVEELTGLAWQQIKELIETRLLHARYEGQA